MLRFLFIGFTSRYFLRGECFKSESNKKTSRHLFTALSRERGIFCHGIKRLTYPVITVLVDRQHKHNTIETRSTKKEKIYNYPTNIVVLCNTFYQNINK